MTADGTRRAVEFEMALDDDTLSYRTRSELNPQLALVIDLHLRWGSFFDNGGFDGYVHGVAVDQANVAFSLERNSMVRGTFL